MSILSLTFRDLQYLAALDEHRNFGKAAKACFVSQPALSAQIKKIEGYLNQTIFDRHNRKVSVTREGEELLDKIHLLLDQAKHLDKTLKKETTKTFAPLTIGMIHTIAPYYPGIFLHDFLSAQSMHRSINLTEGYTEELLTNLKHGKIDMMIASDTFEDENLKKIPIFKEPLMLVINKHHPFASKQTIHLSDLDPKDMIFLKEGNCLRNESIDLCPKNRRGNIKEYYLNNLETLKYMVALNKAYAIVPKMASALNEVLKKNLVVKSIKSSQAYRQISIFIKKTSLSEESEIMAFIEFLKNHIDT